MKRTDIRSRMVLAVCSVGVLATVSLGSAQGGAQGRADFDAFYDGVSQAQAELFRGRAEPLKALWTRASDATLFGAYGGTEEHGSDKVAQRLDWASRQYSEGSATITRLASYVEGNLGYVVQLESIRFKLPGQSNESLLELRATWIFRRERDGWRIVHRHADPQMKRQGPTESTR
jgi:ketosteroid isomerase-like protein